MQITNNIFISFVVAGKSTNEIFEQWELDAPTRPRFGRNWWYWWPSLRTNGGKFRQHENTDINFHWLCFSASLTVFSWGGKCHHDECVHPEPRAYCKKKNDGCRDCQHEKA